MTGPLGLIDSLVAAVPVAIVVAVLIGVRFDRIVGPPSLKRFTPAAVVLAMALAGIAAWFLPSGLSHNFALDACLLVGAGVLAGISPWLVAIDFDRHRLPDRIVLPAGGAVVVVLVVAAVLAAFGGGWSTIARAVVVAIIAGAAFAALYVIGRIPGLEKFAGLGLGDVKLAPLCGFLLGASSWTAGLVGLIVCLLAAAAFALILIAQKKATPASRIAFGPFMLIGTWAAILLDPMLL